MGRVEQDAAAAPAKRRRLDPTTDYERIKRELPFPLLVELLMTRFVPARAGAHLTRHLTRHLVRHLSRTAPSLKFLIGAREIVCSRCHLLVAAWETSRTRCSEGLPDNHLPTLDWLQQRVWGTCKPAVLSLM